MQTITFPALCDIGGKKQLIDGVNYSAVTGTPYQWISSAVPKDQIWNIKFVSIINTAGTVTYANAYVTHSSKFYYVLGVGATTLTVLYSNVVDVALYPGDTITLSENITAALTGGFGMFGWKYKLGEGVLD